MQLKSDNVSSSNSAIKRRDNKRLRKLVEKRTEGFLSCQGSQGDQDMIMDLIQEHEPS